MSSQRDSLATLVNEKWDAASLKGLSAHPIPDIKEMADSGSQDLSIYLSPKDALFLSEKYQRVDFQSHGSWLNVKKGRGLFSRWKQRYVSLSTHGLSIRKSDLQPMASRPPRGTKSLEYRQIASIERPDNGPFDIRLKTTSGTTYTLRFTSYAELFDWHDAIYDRVPGKISYPSDFQHVVHVEMDPTSGRFSGSSQPNTSQNQCWIPVSSLCDALNAGLPPPPLDSVHFAPCHPVSIESKKNRPVKWKASVLTPRLGLSIHWKPRLDRKSVPGSGSDILLGWVQVREMGIRFSRRIILSSDYITLHRYENGPHCTVIFLKDVTAITLDYRKCSVRLDTKFGKHLLTFCDSDEAKKWMDEIYPLCNFGISLPFNFEHRQHVTTDENGFVGLPKHWRVLLGCNGVSARDDYQQVPPSSDVCPGPPRPSPEISIPIMASTENYLPDREELKRRRRAVGPNMITIKTLTEGRIIQHPSISGYETWEPLPVDYVSIEKSRRRSRTDAMRDSCLVLDESGSGEFVLSPLPMDIWSQRFADRKRCHTRPLNAGI